MDPIAVRFTRATDGSSIAYTRFGEGPAFIQLPDIPVALQLHHRIPELSTSG